MLLLFNEQPKHQIRGQPHVHSFLGLHWHIPYERAILAAIFKMVLHWNSQCFQTYSLWSDYMNVLNLQQKFSHIWIKKITQKSVIPKTFSPKPVLSISGISATVFLSLKKNSMEMHCLPLQNYRWQHPQPYTSVDKQLSLD